LWNTFLLQLLIKICFSLRIYEIPEASRQAKGTAIVNLLFITGEEKITAVIPVREFEEEQYLVTATQKGIVKKTSLPAYDTSRKDGIIALTLDDDDELIGVKLTSGEDDVILATKQGLAIRFSEKDVRSMGRTARGVKGITLQKGDYVIGMDICRDEATLLAVTEKGYGKRTVLTEFRTQRRGGKGVIGMNLTPKTGALVGIRIVDEEDEIMLITLEGIMIRISVADISVMGRATQGVRVMRMSEDDNFVALARVVKNEDE
jgi:DNA gyrase subunit A